MPGGRCTAGWTPSTRTRSRCSPGWAVGSTSATSSGAAAISARARSGCTCGSTTTGPGTGGASSTSSYALWGAPRAVVFPERSILCVSRDDSKHIDGVGGSHPDGTSWSLTRQEAVTWLERYGHVFTVGADDGSRVSAVRHRYLRSRGDRSRANNLGSLPEC